MGNSVTFRAKQRCDMNIEARIFKKGMMELFNQKFELKDDQSQLRVILSAEDEEETAG